MKIKFLLTIAAIFTAAIVFFHISSCKTLYKSEKLESTRLIINFPVSYKKIENNVKIFYVTDTIDTYKRGDFILYKLSPTAEFETGQNIMGTEQYFIYRNKEDFGNLFKDLSSEKPISKNKVDSFLSVKGIKGRI